MWRLWLLCTVGLFLIAGAVVAQVQQPRTVLDYFLLLPEREFSALESWPPSERKRFLMDGVHRGDNILDLRNDYLFMRGDGAQPDITIALFRYRGDVLIALRDEGYDPRDPSVTFLRYERGHWRDVTKATLPADLKPRGDYQLPRYGTTILLRSAKGSVIRRLMWRGGKFVASDSPPKHRETRSSAVAAPPGQQRLAGEAPHLGLTSPRAEQRRGFSHAFEQPTPRVALRREPARAA
jgi:hypothetical protein